MRIARHQGSRWGSWVCLVTVACVACDGSEPEVVSSPTPDAALDARPLPDARTDARVEDGQADGPDAPPPDAPLAALRLGVEPVARAVPGEPPDVGLRVAQLESVSAGSRAISVDVRWDELFDSNFAPRAERLNQLGEVGALLRRAGVRLSLCIAVVERTLDARPSNTAWNSTVIMNGLERLVDAVLPLFGEELRVLSFGLEVDRYYSALPQFLRPGFEAALEHARAYTVSHSDRLPTTAVGVVTTHAAWGQAALRSVLQQSDAAVVTYLPLDANLLAEPPSVGVGDLDALYLSVSDVSEADAIKPIVLHRVGYPSSDTAGGSAELQRLFYANLFQALASRRGRFPFVGVFGLNDPPAPRCAAFRLSLGSAAQSHPERAEAAFCSLGLHTDAGVTKPAWGEVLGALATFAAP